MKIRTKVASGIGAFLSAIPAMAAITVVTELQQRTAMDDVSHAAETVTTRSIALMRSAKDIKLDVVQVQQFLTDISATRGLDGLDDGLDDAQRFADKFAADVTAAEGIAEALHRPDILTLLTGTKAAFAPYYEIGQRMAKAYVDQGPAGGNPMMPVFDKASDDMQEQVEKLVGLVDQAVASLTGHLDQTIGRVRQGSDQLLLATGVLSAVGVLVAVMVGALAFTGIVRPLMSMTGSMLRLAEGDVDVMVPGRDRRDEVGAMAEAVSIFRGHMIAEAQLATEKAQEHDRGEADKRAALQGMAETIEAETQVALERLMLQASSMTQAAEEMNASAGRTGGSARTAAAAAAQARETVQAVAGAAEQLTDSMQAIRGQASQSATVIGRAVSDGHQTRATIETLNQEVERIGAVADMIGEIAAKTNLLALNATIEAARAGDAGKGFAVVASEVKALANQTARSTEEISRHINEVRTATEASVAAVMRIEQTITEVNAIAGSIAEAVSRQGAATADIARSMVETAASANLMTGRASEVSAEAGKTGRQAETVRQTAGAMSEAMNELRQSVIRVVRTSTAEVDRRLIGRMDTNIACRVTADGRVQDAIVVNLSDGGAQMTGAPVLAVGSRGMLAIQGADGSLPFIVRGGEGTSLHVAFTLDDVAKTTLERVLQRLHGPASTVAARRA